MQFKGVDFYRLDDLFTDEERMVRDTVRRFVDERVIPIIDKHFEEATFPRELIHEMAEIGLFGGNLPEEYGCANMNNLAYGLVMQELERGDDLPHDGMQLCSCPAERSRSTSRPEIAGLCCQHRLDGN